MVLIFTKLQTDKQDVIEVADFKTISNKKKKYQKNFDICHLILQILFLITITCNNIYSNKCVVRTIRKTKPSELLTSLKESRSTDDKNCTFRVWQILAGGID